MAKRVGVDKWLFGTVLLLVLFGLVMVFSASAVMSQAESGSPYKYVAKQGMYAIFGMVALFALMRVDYRRYNSYPFVGSAVALTTMFLVVRSRHARAEPYPSLVPAGQLLHLPAFGVGKARACALSRILFADPHPCYGRLEANDPARGIASIGLHRPHHERAGPGHRAGLRRCHNGHALSRRNAGEVDSASACWPHRRCSTTCSGWCLSAARAWRSSFIPNSTRWARASTSLSRLSR